MAICVNEKSVEFDVYFGWRQGLAILSEERVFRRLYTRQSTTGESSTLDVKKNSAFILTVVRVCGPCLFLRMYLKQQLFPTPAVINN